MPSPLTVPDKCGFFVTGEDLRKLYELAVERVRKRAKVDPQSAFLVATAQKDDLRPSTIDEILRLDNGDEDSHPPLIV